MKSPMDVPKNKLFQEKTHFFLYSKLLFLSLHKIGCTSAIKASFIALGLHYLCIRQAAPRQLKQALLLSVCTIFATDNKGETNKKSAMSQNNIDFVTYCIGNLARRLGISAGEVYRKLKDSGILTEYIVPSYDVLHTFSKEYLMEDLTEYMKEKGVLA